MFQKSLYNKDIPPACAYCSHGQRASDPDLILCMKQGVVSTYHHCKHYHYDPLLRVPKRMRALPTFCAEDFSLE